ncbi:META domain-containing protein [Acinetobacter bouvetii]|uniref:META domain protein n=1 Tax=Acinetobacter bouvetii TaxID=202951 RepID=A0A811GHX7_9GAMM|nr:META domain-containing protein [Acinetobacter bouvetii]CAB1221419.1 META domain protein [Acinetobacter bouvetii]
MFRQFIVVTSISGFCLLAGCISSIMPPTTDKNFMQLQNKTWLLTDINLINYKATPTQPIVPTLIFNNNYLNGYDGCNQIIGGYAIKGTQIKFSNLASTEQTCLNGTDLPYKFTQTLLNQVVNFEATDSELKLIDNHNQVVLRFKHVK